MNGVESGNDLRLVICCLLHNRLIVVLISAAKVAQTFLNRCIKRTNDICETYQSYFATDYQLFTSHIFLRILRWQHAEHLLEMLGKVLRRGETGAITSLRDRAFLLFQELRRRLQSHHSDEVGRRLTRQ